MTFAVEHDPSGAVGTTVFETSVGWCGLAWGERGIVAVQLPEGDRAGTARRLRRRRPDACEADPPAPIAAARDAIVALLGGERVDLVDIVVDLGDVSAFDGEVYAVARTIPPGRTLTYGEVAARVGSPDLARAVGGAMGRNPCPIIVPCHRVLAAHGALGGFSAPGGAATKRRLLTIEGALPPAPPTLFDA